jgi:hypothetical protein
LVKPDSCDEDTTSSIESMSFTSIDTARSAVKSASADVDAAYSSFATPSPAPCSLGAAQWPLILSDILSSFFQHPNFISFYIFSSQMLRHFEVRSKLLSLFPLLHCVTAVSSPLLHFSIVELVIKSRLSG